MDFVRHDKEKFSENPTTNKYRTDSKEFKKLETTMLYITETYSCFNPNIKNEIYTKKILKKPEIIHMSKDVHSSEKNLISCLNKLTSSNFKNIFNKIQLSIEDIENKDFINTIISTCLNSKTYHELYVGLIFHLFKYGSDEMKQHIIDQINEKFMILFNKDYYIMIHDKDETYDDFCDRMSTKSKIIYMVNVYIMFHFNENISKYLDFEPKHLAEFLYNLLKENIQSNANSKTIELILLCTKECYDIKSDLQIPSIDSLIAWKNLISIDSNLNNLLNVFITDCVDKKLEFITIDLLDVLDKHFML